MTVQATSPKQIWADASVRLAFDKFQTIDLPFTLAGAVGLQQLSDTSGNREIRPVRGAS